MRAHAAAEARDAAQADLATLTRQLEQARGNAEQVAADLQTQRAASAAAIGRLQQDLQEAQAQAHAEAQVRQALEVTRCQANARLEALLQLLGEVSQRLQLPGAAPADDAQK